MQVPQPIVSLALLLALSAPLTAAEPQAARPQATDALLTSGLAAFDRGDHAQAVATFRQLAEKDVPAAETMLGTMAANGQGGAKDEAVAAAWFLRAARSGYAPAQLALADAFFKGRGVAKDPKRATALARAAADQNEPGAARWIARNSPPQVALAQPPRRKG